MNPVPSASYFSLPIAPWQQPPSARVAHYEPRKRRRDSDEWSKSHYEDDGETTDAVSEVTPSGQDLVLSPNEAHQYRIAGLPFNQELPGGNFPHAAPKDSQHLKRGTEKEVMKELSSMSPPIYLPQSSAQQGNPRLQHLAVLTAILHRCLLQGDYVRAGRAWGILLREQFAGRPIDVRTGGRWGIGAEILLRRGRQLSDLASENEDQTSRPCFTREGFEDAKRYYERLVIQHPFRKAAPDAISSMHFYPAMFGLWIYVVQEESNLARESLQNYSDLPDRLSDDEGSGLDFDARGSPEQRQKTPIAGVKENELEQAQQIAARMDEILVSPPYSDSPDLLELRGMVSLWIADLFVSRLPHEGFDDYNSDDDDAMAKESSNSILARREQRLAMEKRETESKKSRQFFEKAKQRGRGVTYNLEHLRLDDTIFSP